jgi:uncharacterized membrane protein
VRGRKGVYVEALGILLGLGLIAAILLAPVLAIIALVRASRLEAGLRGLRTDLAALETRLEALAKRVTTATPPAAATPAAAGSPAPTPAPVAPPAPTPEPTPAAPTSTRPLAAPLPPAVPKEPPPVVVVAPPEPVVPRAAVPPPAQAPPPRAPRPEPEPTGPPEPAFDWEGLLGLKGAAWLGGITLVIAAAFFAKWAIDQGLITPELRIAGLVAAGVGCLTWAELNLRRGFATTANAVSGAGIAILYLAFFAGYSLFHLFPLWLTFVLMSVVTLLAGVLAVRYDAYFTAVLGLLGGFATPIVLSTGVDRPVGLFSYILLLNVGLLSVALRKRWYGVVLLGLIGTFIIELGWFARFMSPEKMVIGLLAFLVLGLLYLLVPAIAGMTGDGIDGAKAGPLLQSGAVGGTLPFLFAVLLAGNPRYAAEWPLLFGYVGLLDAALIAVAVLRGRVALVIGGALATAITLPLWAGQGLSREELWGPTLAAIGLAGLLNLPSRLAARFSPDVLRSSSALLEVAGLVGTTGLGLLGLVLVGRGFGEPPWVFLVLLTALVSLLVERTGESRIPGVLAVGSVALAVLTQVWFFRHPPGDALLRNLAVGLLLTITLAIVAAFRARTPVNADEDEAAVVGANATFLAGLFACLLSSTRGGDPRPMFAALAVSTVLFVVSALRRDWTPLLPLAMLGAAVFSVAWQAAYFQPGDVTVVLPTYFVFYLAFLVLPFVVPGEVREQWKQRALPWLTSALAGVAFFLPLHQAIAGVWGKSWIGALPVVLAAFTVAALQGVSRQFLPRPDPASQAARLRYLALFAALALGFVALAIPLQLDRQWITIGWALEAVAVWWLYGRLPHPGLKTFGAVLFAAVGVRLILNLPNVLVYQERGLPIVNWLLYTYGVPALCCFAGMAFLRRSDPQTRLVPAAAGLGVLLVFCLINAEIFHFYSTGEHVEFSLERNLARDLTLSVAWGLYAITLLVIGIARGIKALRFVSLGFLVLTVGKVFLYDLANLTGIYRILAFLGLGVSLILVSLLYQKVVLAREAR